MPKPALLPGFNVAAAAASATQSSKGGGRKQQQQQNQKQSSAATSFSSSSSSLSSSSGQSHSSPAQRKPLKQQKNNAKKQQQQQRFSTTSSTIRPNPMPSYNRYTPAEKTRTYNLSEYLASLNAAAAAASGTATTTTIRPADNNGKQQYANNVESYHDKLPAAKAPKQVKQATAYANAEASPPLSSSGIRATLPTTGATTTTIRMTTPRQNIPKMFQNYEKVQEIYPEFQAYDGPTRSSIRSQWTRRPDHGSINGGVLMSASYVSNGGNKPSRENAKKLFFTDHNSGITISKKNSTQILLVRSPDIRTSGNAAAHRNETGQHPLPTLSKGTIQY